MGSWFASDSAAAARRLLAWASRWPAATLALSPALPNPSRASASVVLRDATTRVGRATITLYDVAGRAVWTQTEAALGAGEHTITWNGSDARGGLARAGLYFVRLVTDEGERTAKLLRL